MIAIEILSSDRTAILGRTGSGKSTLARRIYERFENGFVYDFAWECNQLGKIVHSIDQMLNAFPQSDKVIFQPEDPINVKLFSEVCHYLFALRNTILYFEEIHNFASSHFIPKELMRIITLGRKKGLGVLIVSQRPSLVNKTILTQCENIIIFNCYPFDAETLKDILGDRWKRIPDLLPFHYLFYTIRSKECLIIDSNGKTIEIL